MKVHECPCVSDSPLFSVYEGFGKLDPVVDIVTTAPPVKLSSVITGSSALVRVTVTRLQLPLAAGASERVHHPCWGNGVDERCLTTAWERETGRESTKRSNRYSVQHRGFSQTRLSKDVRLCSRNVKMRTQIQIMPWPGLGMNQQDMKVQLTGAYQAWCGV